MGTASWTVWTGPEWDHKGPHKREAEGDFIQKRKGQVRTEAEIGVLGAQVKELPAASSSWEWQGTDPALGPPEGTSPAHILILAP